MREQITNCIDAWAMLYESIGTALRDCFGTEGRSILRQAILDYAAERGKKRQEELVQCGCAVNLRTILMQGCDLAEDVRTTGELLRREPEWYYRTVASCPMKEIWERDRALDIGNIYCEEFYHAYWKAAFFQKVQVNVTQVMTNGRDDLCRFSFYLRPANLSEEQREICFSKPEDKDPEIGLPRKEIDELIYEQWGLFFSHCYRNVTARFGKEGSELLSTTLRSLAERFVRLIPEEKKASGVAKGYIASVIPVYGADGWRTAWGVNPDAKAAALYDEQFERFLLSQIGQGKRKLLLQGGE